MSNELRSDPRNQQIVLARAPTAVGGLVHLVVDLRTLRSTLRLRNGQNAKLGQFCGLVHGNVWAVASDPTDRTETGTAGLTKPVAIFCGLRRPRNQRKHDAETFIYITSHSRNYVFPNKNEFGGGPIRAPVPPNSVFVAYVDFGPEAVDEVRPLLSYTLPDPVSGVVSDWEWVRASPNDPRLPVNSTGGDPRYARKVWDERGH